MNPIDSYPQWPDAQVLPSVSKQLRTEWSFEAASANMELLVVIRPRDLTTNRRINVYARRANTADVFAHLLSLAPSQSLADSYDYGRATTGCFWVQSRERSTTAGEIAGRLTGYAGHTPLSPRDVTIESLPALAQTSADLVMNVPIEQGVAARYPPRVADLRRLCPAGTGTDGISPAQITAYENSDVLLRSDVATGTKSLVGDWPTPAVPDLIFPTGMQGMGLSEYDVDAQVDTGSGTTPAAGSGALDAILSGEFEFADPVSGATSLVWVPLTQTRMAAVFVGRNMVHNARLRARTDSPRTLRRLGLSFVRNGGAAWAGGLGNATLYATHTSKFYEEASTEFIPQIVIGVRGLDAAQGLNAVEVANFELTPGSSLSRDLKVSYRAESLLDTALLEGLVANMVRNGLAFVMPLAVFDSQRAMRFSRAQLSPFLSADWGSLFKQAVGYAKKYGPGVVRNVRKYGPQGIRTFGKILGATGTLADYLGQPEIGVPLGVVGGALSTFEPPHFGATSDFEASTEFEQSGLRRSASTTPSGEYEPVEQDDDKESGSDDSEDYADFDVGLEECTAEEVDPDGPNWTFKNWTSCEKGYCCNFARIQPGMPNLCKWHKDRFLSRLRRPDDNGAAPGEPPVADRPVGSPVVRRLRDAEPKAKKSKWLASDDFDYQVGDDDDETPVQVEEDPRTYRDPTKRYADLVAFNGVEFRDAILQHKDIMIDFRLKSSNWERGSILHSMGIGCGKFVVAKKETKEVRLRFCIVSTTPLSSEYRHSGAIPEISGTPPAYVVGAGGHNFSTNIAPDVQAQIVRIAKACEPKLPAGTYFYIEGDQIGDSWQLSLAGALLFSDPRNVYSGSVSEDGLARWPAMVDMKVRVLQATVPLRLIVGSVPQMGADANGRSLYEVSMANRKAVLEHLAQKAKSHEQPRTLVDVIGLDDGFLSRFMLVASVNEVLAMGSSVVLQQVNLGAASGNEMDREAAREARMVKIMTTKEERRAQSLAVAKPTAKIMASQAGAFLAQIRALGLGDAEYSGDLRGVIAKLQTAAAEYAKSQDGSRGTGISPGILKNFQNEAGAAAVKKAAPVRSSKLAKAGPGAAVRPPSQALKLEF